MRGNEQPYHREAWDKQGPHANSVQFLNDAILGPRVAHAGDSTATARTCWSGRCAARPTSRAAAETRLRRRAGARGRYAGVGCLLATHYIGISGRGFSASGMLSESSCAGCCDQTRDEKNLLEVHGMRFHCVEEQTHAARGGFLLRLRAKKLTGCPVKR